MRQNHPDELLDDLLSRPDEQRLREHKYRCAQAVVFGLPVIALRWFGRSLGGVEAARWVGILQMLLASWVMYVGAVGMLVEGLLLLARRRWTADATIALAALALYLWSVAAVVPPIIGRPGPWQPLFHWTVVLIAGWTSLRWWCLHRRAGGSARVEEAEG